MEFTNTVFFFLYFSKPNFGEYIVKLLFKTLLSVKQAQRAQKHNFIFLN